ncbi:MAG: pantoate--beta-alanine ligase [Candidatus Aminicenantes bacterium]|nr:pantoate--beta-alanine ligase [Candidatus Aminicenantes bacterium]NLH76367.1 pantoate--beta-alanine ligase [Acidobacteriota bacterium]
MILVETVAGMKALSREWKRAGKTVGFVPTMGYLHEGHLSLVRESKTRADVTAVSIFVNPTQFGPNEDLDKYPRDLAKDAAYLERAGVDVLFHPPAAEVYPPGYRTYVEVEGLQDKLCGRSRPGHFRGVATVVLKLFETVGPDLAFFGAKDAQQVLIIERMARDLDLGVEVVTCPLVREPDGLALSSRNAYLSPEERQAALALSIGLRWAERAVAAGERDPAKVVAGIRAVLEAEPLARIDYVEAVDPETLEPVAEMRGRVLVAVAAFVGSTRLIDNVRIAV